MRKIGSGPLLAFFGMLFGSVALSVAATAWVASLIPKGDLRGVLLALIGLVLIFVLAIGVYRLFLLFFPLQEGELAEGSRGEFVAHVSSLFFLMLFNSLICTQFLPIPMRKLVYLGLGAKIGRNSFAVGVIQDPKLTVIGDDTIIGHNATLICHVIEGQRFALQPIRIGDRVTIGAHAVILPGVTIEDDAKVATGAVVRKGSHIGSGEIWGGVPASRLS